MKDELDNLDGRVGKEAVKKRFLLVCDVELLRNYEFAQEVYAALSENKWCLRDNPKHIINWKRKEAATTVASARQFGEKYCDFVPSNVHGGVPEGSVTDRAMSYLTAIGYELIRKGQNK